MPSHANLAILRRISGNLAQWTQIVQLATKIYTVNLYGQNFHQMETVQNVTISKNGTLLNFEHDRTKFKLEKRHAELTCIKCHTKEEGDSDMLLLNKLKRECVSCHDDFHRGQFAEYGEQGCVKCHSPDSWKADKFDHNATRFSLKGAHQKVDCAKCHPKIERDGYIFIKYKIEEFKCASCHS